MVEYLMKILFDYYIGIKYVYSDIGYMFFGCIVEKFIGKLFDVYVE